MRCVSEKEEDRKLLVRFEVFELIVVTTTGERSLFDGMAKIRDRLR
jgi:hypothetical protein